MAYRSEYITKVLTEIDTATKAKAERKARLADYRGAKLIADGHTALAMRQRGATPSEMLLAIGGSRPRMYKAMRAAIDAEELRVQPAIDPLLM